MATQPADSLSIPTPEQVRKALGLWHKSPVHGSPLADLLLVRQAAPTAGGNLRLATNQVLLHALTEMATQHSDEAGLLRIRYLDAKTVHLLAIERNLAQATIYVHQQRAIDLLTGIIQEMEQAAREDRRSLLESRLPQPNYTTLVGVQQHLDHLARVIAAPESPGLILLDGIGGIGKTSLADSLARVAAAQSRFTDVAWISAQRQFFHPQGSLRQIPRPTLTTAVFVDELALQLLPDVSVGMSNDRKVAALQSHLAQTPCLVVLDNLEMVADVDQMFLLLQRLAGRSKFLLASRYSFYGTAHAYHLRLPELTEADALLLVRQEAGLRNLPEVAAAPDASLQPIYATVGGNPLALRLVVGLLHAHPLPAILADLADARGAPVDALYTYVYRSSWGCLDELCRRTLLAMPLVSERGGSFQYLAEVSAVPPDALRHALGALVDLNLVDSRGDLAQRRYTIHNLTRTFLLEQVIRWQH